MNYSSATTSLMRNGFRAIELVFWGLAGNAMVQMLVLGAYMRACVKMRGSPRNLHRP